MKKFLFLSVPLAVTALLFSSYSGSDAKYPGGAPAGYTGSPADNKNCTYCHNGNASAVTGWITSDIGPDGYVAGQTYTITVTVTGSGNKGFEVSPQNSSGTLLGTLIAGSGQKLVGSGKYVTHTSASSANPKVWTFQWTAPAPGTGEVTMYGAFALNKSTTKLSTLAIPENTATGIKEQPVSPSVKIFPNPAVNNLAVNFKLAEEANVAISLVSASTGAKTMLQSEFLPEGQYCCNFDCSDQAAGLYILVIESGSQKIESKVLINH